MTYVAPAPVYAILLAANWTRSNSCSGMFPFRLLSDILAANSDCTTPSMTVLALSQMRAADPQGGGLLAAWRQRRTYFAEARFGPVSVLPTTRPQPVVPFRRSGTLGVFRQSDAT